MKNNILFLYHKKVRFFLSFLIIIATLNCSNNLPSQPNAIVFDLGAVLFETKTPILILLRHIKLKTLIQYMLNPYTTKYNIKKKLLTFLDIIKQRPENHTLSDIPVDEHGNALPLLMEEWLSGTMSCNDILSYIKKAVKHNTSLFSCAIEKKVILKIASLIFDPILFTNTQHIHPDAIQSIKKLKTKGFKIYALSNWDKESFAIMKEKYTDFFSLFDGIMVSGEEGLVKPSSLLFTHFLNTYNLAPESCIFIDDQIINVIAARIAGIHALTCPYKKGLLTKKGKANLFDIFNIIQKIKGENTISR